MATLVSEWNKRANLSDGHVGAFHVLYVRIRQKKKKNAFSPFPIKGPERSECWEGIVKKRGNDSLAVSRVLHPGGPRTGIQMPLVARGDWLPCPNHLRGAPFFGNEAACGKEGM